MCLLLVAASGIAGTLVGLRAGRMADAVVVALVLTSLATAAVVDLRCRRLPDAISAPVWAVAWLVMLVDAHVLASGGASGGVDRLRPALVGALVAGAALGVGWLVGMGFGDVKVGALLGLVAGWGGADVDQAANRALVLVLVAVTLGVVVASATRQRRFALGPFLVLAGAPLLVAGLPGPGPVG
jgi:leader peptidase (prepilin peptidase) / N-methyltransferase